MPSDSIRSLEQGFPCFVLVCFHAISSNAFETCPYSFFSFFCYYKSSWHCYPIGIWNLRFFPYVWLQNKLISTSFEVRTVPFARTSPLFCFQFFQKGSCLRNREKLGGQIPFAHLILILDLVQPINSSLLDKSKNDRLLSVMKGNWMWWAMPLTQTIALHLMFWEVSPFLHLVAMRILVVVSVDYLLELTLPLPKLCNGRKENNASDWCSWKYKMWHTECNCLSPCGFFLFCLHYSSILHVLAIILFSSFSLNHLCPLTQSPVSRWDKFFEFILRLPLSFSLWYFEYRSPLKFMLMYNFHWNSVKKWDM